MREENRCDQVHSRPAQRFTHVTVVSSYPADFPLIKVTCKKKDTTVEGSVFFFKLIKVI